MEEQLIEKVIMHEVLYNTKSPNYRDKAIRQEAWEVIGRDLGVKADLAKNTWEKLRRCFINALNRRRSKKGDPSAKKMPPWKFENRMSFLLPFMDLRKTDGEGRMDDVDDQEFDSTCYAQEPETSVSLIWVNPEQSHTDPQAMAADGGEGSSRRKRPKESIPRETAYGQHLLEAAVAVPMKGGEGCYERRSAEMDETEMFFLSMAKMTKQLPPLEQAKIKLQLSNTVLNAQIRISEGQQPSHGMQYHYP